MTDRNILRMAFRRPWSRVILWTWAIYSLAMLAMSLVPGVDVPRIMLLGWDKLGHATAFAVLAVLSFVVFFGRRLWPAYVVVYAAFMGAATEGIQSFTPMRSPSIYDWLADIVGTIVIVAIVAVVAARSASLSALRPAPAGEAAAPGR